MSLSHSVVLIRSSNPAHKSFGTGFSVYHDGQVTYIVTCAHVVQDITNEIKEDGGEADTITTAGAKATLVASGYEDGSGIDIAILSVEKQLDHHLPLRCTSKEKGKLFKTAGFQRNNKDFTIRELDGVFGKPITTGRGEQVNFVNAWDLEIKDTKYRLQDGYSGSPVIDKDNYAVAVVNTKEGGGIRGTAISIEALKKVWLKMPPHLFGQQRLASVVNWLNRRPISVVNRLNIELGSIAFVILIIAIVISIIAPTNSYQNILASIAYYLALAVFCSELCVLAVHVLAVYQQWRWLWLVILLGVGIVVYLPGIIFSLGGPVYDLIATIVPLVFSLGWAFALRKTIAPKPEDHSPK